MGAALISVNTVAPSHVLSQMDYKHVELTTTLDRSGCPSHTVWYPTSILSFRTENPFFMRVSSDEKPIFQEDDKKELEISGLEPQEKDEEMDVSVCMESKSEFLTASADSLRDSETSDAQQPTPLESIERMWAQTEPPPPRKPPILSKHQCGVCFKHFSSSSALQVRCRNRISKVST